MKRSTGTKRIGEKIKLGLEGKRTERKKGKIYMNGECKEEREREMM